MLKRLISTVLILTLSLSSFTVTVSATEPENYKIIYSRNFDKEPTGNNLRFLYSGITENNLGDWTYNYSSKYLQCLAIDGSNVMMETMDEMDSNVYRFAENVTSGVFYLSMDIGFHDQGLSWDDGYITLYSDEYDISDNNWDAMFKQTGLRYALKLEGKTASNGKAAYMIAKPGEPYEGLVSCDEYKAVNLTADKLHRLDFIYDLKNDYVWIYLDGELMRKLAVADQYRDNIDQISAIGIRTRPGMFVDNISIANGPANSFDYDVKNITESSFDIEFNQSVHSLTTENVLVNDVTVKNIIKKNAGLYTVIAEMTNEPVITLYNVTNILGETINDTKAYNQLVNIDFDTPVMDLNNINDTSESIYADGTFRITGGVNKFALRNNQATYRDSDKMLRIVAKAHSGWHDSFCHFDFSNYAYAMGKLTIAYNEKFTDTQNFETWLVCEDVPSDNTGGFALPSFLNGNNYGYNGTGISPRKNVWHSIKHILDFDKNTLTSYIDGTVFYQGALKNAAYFDDKTKVKGIRFCLGSDGTSGQAVYMDDWDIHTEYVPNASGIYVSNAKTTGTTGDGEEFTYTAKLFNTTDSPVNLCLLTGIYNGETLIKANYTQSENIAAGTFLNASFGAICDANTTAVKGFIWDSLTNLTPLCLGFEKIIVPELSNTSAVFDDVDEKHPYFEAINLLSIMELTEGNGNGRFYPDQFITNGEFADMTAAAFSIGGESKHSFKDATDYAEAIEKAATANIIKGVPADEFVADEEITQQVAAAILVNVYEKTKNAIIPTTDAIESFSDGDMVSDWAVASMDKAATYRFVPVGSETMLRPTVGVTRGEAAQLISNVLLTLGELRTNNYTSSTSFIQTKDGNIFLRSDKADIGVKTEASIFGWEVRGYYGDILKKGYEKTQNGEARLNFDDLDLGHYSLKVFATDENGVRHDLAETFFAIIDDYDFMSVAYDESPFGMNTSYYLYYLGWSPEYTHEMVYNSGARNIRDGCSWRSFEKGEGNYVLFQPETIEAFKQYGMTQLYSAGYSHPLYDGGTAPYTDEGIQAFANYVKAIYDLHDGYVQYVDVHNEWWAERFGGGPANCSPVTYSKLAKKTWEAVKPTYPDSRLGLVVGFSTDYRDWTEELFSQGALAYADYLQYHTYTRNPETDIKADVEFFNDMVEKYGNGKKVGIWLTETGADNAPLDGGITMKEKAALIPRQHVVSFANGIEKVYNYNLMNDGANPANNEDNFGLVYNLSSVYGALVPKEAYVSYAVMTRQLTGLDFKETKRADNIHHYVFEGNGRKVETLYSLEDTSVTLLTSTPVKATDIMGIENTYYPLDGKIYLDLCPEMLYLEGDFEVSDTAIPINCSVTNAASGSDTQFNFVASGELAGKSLTGRVYKDTFNVADGYSFEAPAEAGERTYIIDLEASEKPFARLRQTVEFTN